MNWPPDPNKKATNQPVISSQMAHEPTGQEWKLLEKTLMASIEEQRRARRWNIFFKLLTFGYLILIFLIMGRGCATQPGGGLEAVSTTEPHLAVVDVQGAISASSDANAEDVSDALRQAFSTESAKAVALNINSPGGSPVQSDEIWQTMMDLRQEYPDKKLYAVIGDIGASGAYYIASAADEIYVNPSSLVGSIGVIMPNYDIQGLMDKMGVKDRTMHAGEYKDILSLSRPMTEFEQQHINGVLANTHQHFIDAVKQGRGERLKNPEENQLFSGLFWTGEQAIALGLADKKGGLSQLEKQLELDTTVNYTPIDPMRAFLDHFALKMGSGLGSALNLKILPQEQNQTELR